MSVENNIENDLKQTLNKQDTQKISNDTEDMNDTTSTETQDMTTSSLPSTSDTTTTSTSANYKNNLNTIPVKMGGTLKRKVKKNKTKKNKSKSKKNKSKQRRTIKKTRKL